jgi:hypothetical protein
MVDREIRSSLLSLIRRDERNRLLNRLVGYGLWCLSAYFVLLGFLAVLNYPLYLFHLLFYSSLALLPLFLLLRSDEGQERSLLRRLDEHCQLESYLTTSSPEHRGFMERRVAALARAAERSRVGRFRLERLTVVHALTAVGGLTFLVVSSWVTLHSLASAFVPGSLKSRLVELATQSAAAAEQPGALGQPASQEPAGKRAVGEESPPLEAQRLEATEPVEGWPERLWDLETRNLAAEPQAPPPALREDKGFEETSRLDAGGPADARSLLEAGVQRPSEEQPEATASAAGTGETGRAFKESPLRDYRSAPERITAPGGHEVAAASALAERREASILRSLFGDFPLGNGAGVDFDPRLAAIKRRFRELYDERF